MRKALLILSVVGAVSSGLVCTFPTTARAAASVPTTTPTKPMSNSSLLNKNRFLMIAHRGASAYAPEHTIPAYEMAKKVGADYIEIDAEETKDGYLVAMHDYTVNRTTNGRGPIKSYTLKQLERLDAGSWFNRKYPKLARASYVGLKVPTLDQIFDHFGTSVNYYIETKNPAQFPGMEEKMVKILRKHHLIGPSAPRGKVIIESVSQGSLKKIHALDSRIPLIQLVPFKYPARITDKQLKTWKQYAVGIGINYDSLTANVVQRVRRAGLLLHPWTVNDKSEMHKLILWGVTGIFTNKPDVLKSVRKGMMAGPV
jgi:glycerophosphoryl diester phosphodiesterase